MSSLLSVLAALAFLMPTAFAANVDVIGLTEGKAVISVGGGAPRTLAVGETSREGVKLISASREQAVLEYEGKRETLRLGQSIAASYAPAAHPSVTLVADGQGHFITTGAINGAPLKFLVDTGATMISMSQADAKRAGINFLKGEPGYSSTANGVAQVYKVKLDNVRIGGIVLDNVDGLVHAGASGLPFALLGMSFLNRVEMKRDGTQMTLTKRY